MPIDVATLQRAHPEWNLVDAVESPYGGIWALGADGGVFTLDATGAPSGAAPFFGSYQTPEMAVHRNTPRNFVAIQVDQSTGGYSLIGNDRSRYTFFDPNRKPTEGAPGTTLPSAGPAAPVAPGKEAAYATLEATLTRLGLSGLIGDAWGAYKEGGGSVSYVTDVWLPTSQAYKDRFPGIEAIPGVKSAWTPAEYIQYEERARAAVTRAGLDQSFVEQTDIGEMIRGGVAVTEIEDRVALASDAAYNADPAAIAAMERWGLTHGDITAYFLDFDKGQSFAQKKAAYAQAGIAGGATRAGLTLSQAEAEDIFRQGVSPEQVGERAGNVARISPLFAETAEESEDFGRAEQIGLIAGTPEAETAVERRRAARTARFGGGGGAAGAGTEQSGLGTAT